MMFPLEARGRIPVLVFSSFWGRLPTLAHGCFLCLPSRQHSPSHLSGSEICFHRHVPFSDSDLPASARSTCDYFGSALIIQDNFPILRSLI